MFFLQRPEKGYKLITNGHSSNGDLTTTDANDSTSKHMNGHVNGKINGLTNGMANGGSANGYMNGSAYKNGAVLANGVNGHTDLTQRKVK